MNRTVLTAGFIASAFALLSVSQAQAYKMHYWSDGTVSWLCNDGTAHVLDDGSEPTESQVIASCADHGGMATAPGGLNAVSKPSKHASEAGQKDNRAKKEVPAVRLMR